ncbi:MAG: hypothetical protein KGR26_02820 [Cyanobacteria bacterium REEB65]|nr:hypothetical protein [Cyanobacteria bacterium REEB65]
MVEANAGLRDKAWGALNGVALATRKTLRWRLPGLTDRPAPLDGLLDFAPDPSALFARLADWERQYGFAASRLATDLDSVRAALCVLDLLETALLAAGVSLPDSLSALDVGAKNWHYVRALWALLRGFGGRPREVRLTGIEVDPFAVYDDWHSRYDWATLYAKPLAGARFIVGDFLAHQQRYDLVVVLFPFLNREEHLEMGLPLQLYQPLRLLAHACKATRPGGHLVVSCFDYEQPALDASWRELGQVPILAQPHAPVFAPADHGTYVTVLAGC